jgi:hypothetical protein
MTHQTGLTQVALPTHSTTTLTVLYQQMKQKAYGYFINTPTQRSF